MTFALEAGVGDTVCIGYTIIGTNCLVECTVQLGCYFYYDAAPGNHPTVPFSAASLRFVSCSV